MKKLPILLLLFLATVTVIHAQSKLIFVMRVDDIMSRNTAILPRSIAPFEQVAAARGAKVTWVTIPHRLIESANSNGAVKRELQASAQRGHEIALHGYNHICQRCNQSGHEMYCTTFKLPFTYEQQTKLVLEGLQILVDSLGMRPRSFISPGHVEDTTTYKVLYDQSFQWISSPATKKQPLYRTLYNLSPQDDFTWQMTAANYPSQLKTALQAVRKQSRTEGYYCMVFHDPFVRQGYENAIVLKWTAELLDSLKAEYQNGVQFMTLSEAAQHFAQTSVVAHRGVMPPSAFVLSQNYPNPFNPETTIKYQLPNSAQVLLAIFDLSGRRTATLESGFRAAGEHLAHWNGLDDDGRRVATGVYLYRLEATAAPGRVTVLTKKLTILK